jgi:hypothetical protein
VVLHPHPVTEDRAAGERAGRVDGEHADAQSLRPVGAHQLVGQGRLADAGRPGQPDHLGLTGVPGQGGRDLRQALVAVLDEAHEPRHGPGVTLPGLRDERRNVPTAA